MVRSIVWPENGDQNREKVARKEGVLEVLRVKAEQAKPKQIEISVN